MSSSRSNSGIRNLRAMFENGNGPTSPEPRGRSPAAERQGENPRPIPKVRTSFVAVEKSGQFGGETLSASKDMDKNVETLGDREDTADGNQHTVAQDADVENGKGDLEVGDSPLTDQKGPKSVDGDNKAHVAADEEGAASKSDEPAVSEEAAEEGANVQHDPVSPATKSAHVVQNDDNTADLPSPSFKDTATSAPSKTNRKVNTGLPGGKARTGRPSLNTGASATSSSKPSTTMISVKSPKTPNTLGRAKSSTSSSITKGIAASKSSPAGSSDPKPNISSPRQPASSSTLKTGAAAANKANRASFSPRPLSHTSPTNKPRAKSPTRPARVPASATAHTTASAAKTGGVQNSAAPAQKKSIAPSSKTTNSTRRQPTNNSRVSATTNAQGVSRPSIPARTISERQQSRVNNPGAKPSAESFLQRMMRPTASSASKTHEKTEVKSPPKRTSMLKPNRKSGNDMAEKEKAEPVNGRTSVQRGRRHPEDLNVEHEETTVAGDVADKESAQADQEVSVQD